MLFVAISATALGLLPWVLAAHGKCAHYTAEMGESVIVIDRSPRYCVIGAGSSGLTAAKHLLERGFSVDVLERERDLGGNWNYALPCSRVYRSTHMISSKSFTQYTDFPMPHGFPDYPHHSQVLEYLRAYAHHFGVDRVIEYGTSIERLEPADEGKAWHVTLANGVTRRYEGVLIANGHNWSPRWPSYPGEFAGAVLHSAEYKTPEIFAGKRVLIIGGGNSGCDIAVEASQNGRAAFHSTRRGYHYIPKYLFGRPSDALGDRLARRGLPLRVRRAVISAILRLVNGPAHKSGLPKPDHRLFETHPVVNSLLAYYVKHGAVKPKPEVERLDGDRVHFADGTSEQIDVIVYATGYNLSFPFIDSQHLNWREGRPQLYKYVFHPTYDNLFVAGLIQPDAGLFGLVDRQCHAISLFLSAARDGLPQADMLRQRKATAAVDFTSGIRYQDSPRHRLEVEHWGYAKDLERLIDKLDHEERSPHIIRFPIELRQKPRQHKRNAA